MVENRQTEVLSIIGVFTVLAFIFVLVRVYSRYLGRNFGWDDYLILGGMVLLLGETLAMWKFILLSWTGYHMRDIPKKSIEEQVRSNRWNFAVQLLYHPLMFSIRASIIMFLFRMKDHRRRIRYSLHVVFWLNVIYAISTTLGNILQCTPAQYAWNKPAMDHKDASGNLIAGGKCIDSRTFILTSCALSIFMDLIIIPIPSIMVWNLQMPRKTKLLVVVVMSLGWVATATSVGRFIVYFYRFAPTNVDRTWNIGLAISIAEPAVHIMTACAPATKCLFRYLFPYFARSKDTTHYEDRLTGQKSAPRRSFQFGFGENRGIEEIGMTRASRDGDAEGKEDAELKKLSTVYSRESMKGGDDKASMVEAEPKHCLGHAK